MYIQESLKKFEPKEEWKEELRLNYEGFQFAIGVNDKGLEKLTTFIENTIKSEKEKERDEIITHVKNTIVSHIGKKEGLDKILLEISSSLNQ